MGHLAISVPQIPLLIPAFVLNLLIFTKPFFTSYILWTYSNISFKLLVSIRGERFKARSLSTRWTLKLYRKGKKLRGLRTPGKSQSTCLASQKCHSFFKGLKNLYFSPELRTVLTMGRLELSSGTGAQNMLPPHHCYCSYGRAFTTLDHKTLLMQSFSVHFPQQKKGWEI